MVYVEGECGHGGCQGDDHYGDAIVETCARDASLRIDDDGVEE